MSVDDFAGLADLFLKNISKLLRKQKYRFSPLRPVLLKKQTGKDRLICVPTVGDRIVQGALQDYLAKDNRYGLDNGVSFGFVRGQGVKSAAKMARQLREKNPFAYKTDITSFFDSISREDLRKAIRKRIGESSLHDLLFKAMECEIERTTGNKQRRIQRLKIKPGLGVRQGMPLSPFFANLILFDFDAAMKNHRFNMVRYADDLIVFARSEIECQEIHEACKAELAAVGLNIPEISEDPNVKTKVYAPDKTAEFLGVGLVKSGAGYRIDVTDEQIQDIQRELLKLGELNELVNQQIDISNFFKRLNSSIAGYAGSYHFCDNARALWDVLESVRGKILRRLFVDGLGMRVAALTPKQRQFLGF